jgi:hypothetical protein
MHSQVQPCCGAKVAADQGLQTNNTEHVKQLLLPSTACAAVLLLALVQMGQCTRLPAAAHLQHAAGAAAA